MNIRNMYFVKNEALKDLYLMLHKIFIISYIVSMYLKGPKLVSHLRYLILEIKSYSMYKIIIVLNVPNPIVFIFFFFINNA